MLKDALYSVLWNKCSKCHQGDVFITKNPYKLKQFDKMNENCSHCGELFNKEPGYFYGAMYVSYGLMVGWFVFTWVLNTFVVKADTIPYLIFLSVTILLFTPLTFRISRLIWINMFSKFDKSKAKQETLH